MQRAAVKPKDPKPASGEVSDTDDCAFPEDDDFESDTSVAATTVTDEGNDFENVNKPVEEPEKKLEEAAQRLEEAAQKLAAVEKDRKSYPVATAALELEKELAAKQLLQAVQVTQRARFAKVLKNKFPPEELKKSKAKEKAVVSNTVEQKAVTEPASSANPVNPSKAAASLSERLLGLPKKIEHTRTELLELIDKKNELAETLKQKDAMINKATLFRSFGGHFITKDKDRLNREFFAAIRCGNRADAIKFLRAGAEIDKCMTFTGKGADAKKESKITPLWWCLLYSPNTEMAKFLLREGADPNQRITDEFHFDNQRLKNHRDSTPLIFLAQHDNLTPEVKELANLLLEEKAEVNARDRLGLSALHWAARGGCLDMIVYLCAHQADRAQLSIAGNTPQDELKPDLKKSVLGAFLDPKLTKAATPTPNRQRVSV